MSAGEAPGEARAAATRRQAPAAAAWKEGGREGEGEKERRERAIMWKVIKM